MVSLGNGFGLLGDNEDFNRIQLYADSLQTAFDISWIPREGNGFADWLVKLVLDSVCRSMILDSPFHDLLQLLSEDLSGVIMERGRDIFIADIGFDHRQW
ncbi:hypothetical protein V6N12_070341 [Hibiscus sabdariffa]|uniref:RNase H type-1 domain-containing protein n=1 Tax=Hibiscus sabdariffa TaxID=183260 RepID=A0ABR2FGJ8_9ROSI